MPTTHGSPFIKRFAEITLDDLPAVGGKNASLGELTQALRADGVPVPDGFAITADAFRYALHAAGLDQLIQETLAGLDVQQVTELQRRGAVVRSAIEAAPLPADLREAIAVAYRTLQGTDPTPPDVAVRSSATAEDLPGASFAGQQETFLHVQGIDALLRCVQRSFASLFTDRAISYRAEMGFAHTAVALSVGVQRMVRADRGAAGVLFTIDTETGFPRVVLISAAYGLGELVVKGAVTPDEYTVFKPTLATGHRPILRKQCGSKAQQMIYDTSGEARVLTVPVSPDDQARWVLTDDEILQLARWGAQVEAHYSRRHGVPTPMDLEWAKDGVTGQLFILQARPETVQSRRSVTTLERYQLMARSAPLLRGRSVGMQIAAGRVRVVTDLARLSDFQPGEVLVADRTDPDWQPIMKQAAAIITNRGGRTCHAAIVSRELGVPAIVGTETGTTTLRDGQLVTVCCAEGEVGVVYEGTLPFVVEHTDLAALERPRTKIMLNVANPDDAFRLAMVPNDGVGLARMEFIIADWIGIHPLALLDFAALADAEAKAEIARRTAAYAEKPEYFVDQLAQGIAMLAAAFHPHDVILRFSDFKSNEYANLLGGRAYEPVEENPMLGFRGASRYYHPRYRAAFALECQAVQRVRDVMGLTNLKVMIPFCRTMEEARLVQAEMATHGLVRGAHGLEVYVMCEIPSNVVLAADFATLFDGFSIGSNDLTQLILGVDRDSSIVAPVFDERNPAVKAMIAQVIATCRTTGRKIGICGQAPSDYPDFAQFLVEHGIDSLSLNPDAVLSTMAAVLATERALPTSPATAR